MAPFLVINSGEPVPFVCIAQIPFATPAESVVLKNNRSPSRLHRANEADPLNVRLPSVFLVKSYIQISELFLPGSLIVMAKRLPSGDICGQLNGWDTTSIDSSTPLRSHIKLDSDSTSPSDLAPGR